MSIKKLIKNEKGSAYIEFLVSFYLIIVVIAFGISVLSIFSIKSNLDTCADTLIKVAETAGNTDLDLTVQKLQETTGRDFTVSWDNTEYISGTNNVQLGDVIFLTLTDEFEIGVGKWTESVTIHSRREGMSEKYYK